MEKIAHCDVFVVLDNIQFNKNGWQNRNKIKTGQGEGLLTVPVMVKAEQRLDEVKIRNSSEWVKNTGEQSSKTKAKHHTSMTTASFLSRFTKIHGEN